MARVPAASQRLSAGDLDPQDNVPGERSLIASYKPDRPIALREREYDLHLVAYESFTTDGSADNTETFNLSHDLYDAASVPDDFLLNESGNVVSPDSVDYANDSFDYTDDGTDNTLHAYYVVADQARVEIQKASPKGSVESIVERDAGLINRREQTRDPLAFGFDHPLEGLIPADWRLEIYVDAPTLASSRSPSKVGSVAEDRLQADLGVEDELVEAYVEEE
jgi:hypothetical protein